MAPGGGPSVSGNYGMGTLAVNAPYGTAPDGVPYLTAQAAGAAQADGGAQVPDPGWGQVYQNMAATNPTAPAGYAQQIAAAMQQTGATVQAPQGVQPATTGGSLRTTTPMQAAAPAVTTDSTLRTTTPAATPDAYGVGSGLNGSMSQTASPFGGQLNTQYGLPLKPQGQYAPPRSFIAPIRR